MNEWTENFLKKVEQMRNAQKNYFKTRSLEWLKESKRLEAEVDDLVVIGKQPSDIPADN
ncbi:MAG: hypothetical protein IJU61_06050 [Victivallales bacterium]|nr:hypothetical protein [Victivallales bacterium]